MSFEEKEVADQVADEILTVKEDDNRLFFILILVFLACLIFLVSSVSFAVFDTYYNGGNFNGDRTGGKKEIIKVKTKIIVDDKGNDEDKDKEKQEDKDKKEDDKSKTIVDNKSVVEDNVSTDETTTTTTKEIKKTTKKPVVPEDIDTGVVLFNFIEKSNYINMSNVFPTADNVGKHLTGDNETFDFNISASLKDVTRNVAYEISIVPIAGNTIKTSDLRVYLLEDDNEVSVTGRDVNTYSQLPNSTRRRGGKLLYKKVISSDASFNYTFKMWYAETANVYKDSKKFSCKIAVDAYYE